MSDRDPEAGTDSTPDDDPGLDADPDVDVDGATSDARFGDDPEKRRFLRGIASEIRADSSESKQVAAFLQRVSDLYDPAEDTSPEEIYRNVEHIVETKSRGGLDR
ncbi:hypothetical protein ACFQAS_02430 [Halopenitus salinus]|uniref:Uncharacterized protein n=1 Tax=Halopenitus salinus TaxID=1198295 RepID=A0ABD5UVS5_9EURY